jgi:hypothetical protein
MGRKRGVVVLIVAGVCAAVALTGCAGAAPPKASPEILIEDQLREDMRLPAMDMETMDWIDRIQRELGADENFGSPAISEDRSTVTITWYGDPSIRLQEVIAEAPEKLTVVIQPAAFRPAELAELVRRAVTTPYLVPGVEVAMGAPEVDGSGIMIGIVDLPADRTLGELAVEFGKALDRADVPVAVEVSGRIVPISG